MKDIGDLENAELLELLGPKLLRFALARAKNQAELSRLTRIDQTTLSRITKGERSFSWNHVIRLLLASADELGLDLIGDEIQTEGEPMVRLTRDEQILLDIVKETGGSVPSSRILMRHLRDERERPRGGAATSTPATDPREASGNNAQGPERATDPREAIEALIAELDQDGRERLLEYIVTLPLANPRAV